MSMDAILARMRKAVLDGEYVMTIHALMEMRADLLDVADVEAAVLTGSIQQEFTDDPRGPRYEIVGQACDLSTPVGVVARFTDSLLIITVYEVDL